MGLQGRQVLPLLVVVLLRLASSRRVRSVSEKFHGNPTLADFGAALPEGANVSEAEVDAIVQKLVEARDDEEGISNRCTISLDPLLVDGKIGPDGLVVVVEPPGEGARHGAQVRVNMYTVPSAREWYCRSEPVDPMLGAPLRMTSHVVMLKGPYLCRPEAHRGAEDFLRWCLDFGLLDGAPVLTQDNQRHRAFLIAAAFGDWECVITFFSHMSARDLRAPDLNGMTALHYAAKSCRSNVVETLLRKIPDDEFVDAVTVDGHTALHLAMPRCATRENFLYTEQRVVYHLLRRMNQNATSRQHIAARDHMGKTALHAACADVAAPYVGTIFHMQKFLWLLEYMSDAEVGAVDALGRTALHYCAKRGTERLVEKLLERMVMDEINVQDEQGMTALHHAAQRQGYWWLTGRSALLMVDLIAWRMDRAGLDAVDADGKTAPRLAKEAGNYASAATIRQGGGLDEDENCEGQQRLVRELLDRMGRSVTLAQYIAARDNMGWTALHAACSLAYTWYGSTAGHTANVRLLLQRMDAEDVAAVDDLGCTALHIAARRGLSKLVQELLERMDKAAIRKKDIYGKTALHCAAELGHLPAVELIATHMDRAGLDAKDARGRTAEELARGMGHANAAALLGRALATIDES